ncbi:hypothetical protein PLEOSDRAFT_159616 [Pleurotus ostreatus PC15]|uniref:Uncharacterized protein n=1 Tax=Pleurotus ostreatus (strain PC15) TaxID=1137138 RepID=A0A067NEK9_PLEO1|nr:hypothetical protein PLEOSDRAFT_159616 [Pleurotus ostreatus PC15]
MSFSKEEVRTIPSNVLSRFYQDLQSKFVAIFCQTLLYGAYAVIFLITHWVLVHRQPRGKPINWTMVGISLAMFILATMHIAVNFTRIIKAFVIYKDEPGGPAAFFDKLAEFTQLFGSTIYVVQTLLGDSVVLLRCYIVWGRRLSVVLFPAILLLGSTASGIGILYSMAHVVPEAEIFAVQLQKWILTFFSMTFATNIICTSLVAFRIWHNMKRESAVFGGGRNLRPVLFLVVESGAVYSATLLALLVLYKTESWFQYVLLDVVSPIVGLVFSMIIVRIGLGLTTTGGETRGPFTSQRENARPSDGEKEEEITLETFVAAPRVLEVTATMSSGHSTYPDTDTTYAQPSSGSIDTR